MVEFWFLLQNYNFFFKTSRFRPVKRLLLMRFAQKLKKKNKIKQAQLLTS